MAAGSIFLAPLADKIGRRFLILVCLIIAGLSICMWAVLWFITGVGVGGILVSSTYWQVNIQMRVGEA
ncbi:hypothetical protein ACPR111641_02525 [Acinetobacter pragensis]